MVPIMRVHILVLLAVSVLFSGCDGAMRCRSTLASPKVINDDIIVRGGRCTLKNLKVTGDIFVQAGGNLTTSGSVVVLGKVLASSSGDVRIEGNTEIKGDIRFINSASELTVSKSAKVGNIVASNDLALWRLHRGAQVVLRGSAKGVQLERSSVFVSEASIRSEGISSRLARNVVVEYSNLVGGIKAERSRGRIELESNDVLGPVSIIKCRESVTVQYNHFKDDFSVYETDRRAEVTIMGNHFNDEAALIRGGSALVEINHFDDKVEVTDFAGEVDLWKNTFTILEVSRNSNCVVLRKNVGRILFVTENAGGLLVTGNTFEEATLAENTAAPSRVTRYLDGKAQVLKAGMTMKFWKNEVGEAKFKNNLGNTSIYANAFDSVICSSNNPRPVGEHDSPAQACWQ